jgi:hypothetical protein
VLSSVGQAPGLSPPLVMEGGEHHSLAGGGLGDTQRYNSLTAFLFIDHDPHELRLSMDYRLIYDEIFFSSFHYLSSYL